MWPVCKKELIQFLSSLTGFIAICGFLIISGLCMFVFPDTNIPDYGYASLQPFFDLAPWILLLLVPAITMRSFAEEFKTGSIEILYTKPIGTKQLIGGKYWGSFLIVCLSLLPTLLYGFAVSQMAEPGGLDLGATAGSYLGLFLLAAVFTAIGICCSSFTSNSVAAFLIGILICFLLYSGFDAMSRIPAFEGSADYYIALLGIDYHYNNISRGVIVVSDLVYFLSLILLAYYITNYNLKKR